MATDTTYGLFLKNLRQTNQKPLDWAEERRLASLIQQGVALIHYPELITSEIQKTSAYRYFTQGRRYDKSKISPLNLTSSSKDILEQAFQAALKLRNSNLRLLIYCIKKYTSTKTLSQEDLANLISEGFQALDTCVVHYNGKYRFSSYVVGRILRRFGYYLSREYSGERLMPISYGVKARYKQIKSTYSQFLQTQGFCKLSTLSKELRISENDIVDTIVLVERSSVNSLDQFLSEDRSDTLLDTISIPVIEDELNLVLHNMLKDLPLEQRQAIVRSVCA